MCDESDHVTTQGLTCETLQENLVRDAAVPQAQQLQVVDVVQPLPELRELLTSPSVHDRVHRLDGGLPQEPVQDESLQVWNHISQLVDHQRLLVLVLDPLHLLIDPGQVRHSFLGLALLDLELPQHDLVALDGLDLVLVAREDLRNSIKFLHVDSEMLKTPPAVILFPSNLDTFKPDNQGSETLQFFISQSGVVQIEFSHLVSPVVQGQQQDGDVLQLLHGHLGLGVEVQTLILSQVLLNFPESQGGITTEDWVLDRINLWWQILNVLVHKLVVVDHVPVDHVPAVAEEVVEQEEDHEGKGEDQGRHEDEDDGERHQNTTLITNNN